MKLSPALKKAGVFIQWYARFDTVDVGFRTDQAVIPKRLRENETLVLRYGRVLVVPIPDLEVTEEGISATLSFDRVPHKTFVPWAAVLFFLQPDGNGIAFDAASGDVPVAAEEPAPPARDDATPKSNVIAFPKRKK